MRTFCRWRMTQNRTQLFAYCKRLPPKGIKIYCVYVALCNSKGSSGKNAQKERNSYNISVHNHLNYAPPSAGANLLPACYPSKEKNTTREGRTRKSKTQILLV